MGMKRNKKYLLLIILFLSVITMFATVVPLALVSPEQSEESEIRGIFVKECTDWTPIIDTCSQYGINWVVSEAFGTYFARYPSNYVDRWNPSYDVIAEGIKQAHSHSMKFNAMMLVCLRPNWLPANLDVDCEDANGNHVYWLCPNKPEARNLVKNLVTEVATKYPDLDGFVYDYIRYPDEGTSVCYCDFCKQAFVADTGLSEVNWPLDVLSGGKYYDEFLMWRSTPITNLVRDIRIWMKAINPDLTFSAAVLPDFSNVGNYQYRFRGQNVTGWIDEEIIDVICPMVAGSQLTDYLLSSQAFMIGGKEGKIAMVPYVAYLESSSSLTIEQFKSEIDAVRNLGADGFIIYRWVSGFEPFLASLSYPETFSTSNLKVSVLNNVTTISWNSSKLAIGTLEYNTSKIFTVETLVNYDALDYKMIYKPGIVLKENTPAIYHSLSFPSIQGQKYYFRIQTEDENNILTSTEYSFINLSPVLTVEPVESPSPSATQIPIETTPNEPNWLLNLIQSFINSIIESFRRAIYG